MPKTYTVIIWIVAILIIIGGVAIAVRGAKKVSPVAQQSQQVNDQANGSNSDVSPAASSPVASSTSGATDTSSATDSSTNASTITVTYNGTTFSPAQVTVMSGTTVKFVNQSNKLVWVASDPHPTHTDYPGFDAKKGLTQGQSYEFTFDKIGTWGYHNHLNPSQTGSVIVQ
jgi:plastocyanin